MYDATDDIIQRYKYQRNGGKRYNWLVPFILMAYQDRKDTQYTHIVLILLRPY